MTESNDPFNTYVQAFQHSFSRGTGVAARHRYLCPYNFASGLRYDDARLGPSPCAPAQAWDQLLMSVLFGCLMDFIQNLFNVIVINCEFTFSAFLGYRFPDFYGYEMPAFRTSYFISTNNF